MYPKIKQKINKKLKNIRIIDYKDILFFNLSIAINRNNLLREDLISSENFNKIHNNSFLYINIVINQQKKLEFGILEKLIFSSLYY
jgi:hypothetical protein